MKITDRIVKIFNESGQLYGSPKIAVIINRDGGDKVSQKYVLRIMNKLGIKPKYIRHRTITTVSRSFSSELKNILHRQFNPDSPMPSGAPTSPTSGPKTTALSTLQASWTSTAEKSWDGA